METDNAVFDLEVPLTPAGRFDPESAEVFFKPQPSLPLNNAIRSPTAVEFLKFARIPLAHIEPQGSGFQVRLRDMRFEAELSGRRGIVAVIDLNKESLVTGERLEFDSTPGN